MNLTFFKTNRNNKINNPQNEAGLTYNKKQILKLSGYELFEKKILKRIRKNTPGIF